MNINQSNKQKVLDISRVYSAREALQFLPRIGNEPAMRKFIEDDMANKNILDAKIIVRGTQRRFFIKGSNLLKIIQQQK